MDNEAICIEAQIQSAFDMAFRRGAISMAQTLKAEILMAVPKDYLREIEFVDVYRELMTSVDVLANEANDAIKSSTDLLQINEQICQQHQTGTSKQRQEAIDAYTRVMSSLREIAEDILRMETRRKERLSELSRLRDVLSAMPPHDQQDDVGKRNRSDLNQQINNIQRDLDSLQQDKTAREK